MPDPEDADHTAGLLAELRAGTGREHRWELRRSAAGKVNDALRDILRETIGTVITMLEAADPETETGLEELRAAVDAWLATAQRRRAWERMPPRATGKLVWARRRVDFPHPPRRGMIARMESPAVLFTPGAERRITTNAWALFEKLRATGGPDLSGWPALLEWVAADPGRARAAVRDYLGPLAEGASGRERGALADLSLFLDVRPDDVLLVADPQPFPWDAAGPIGARLIRYAGSPRQAQEGFLEQAAAERATILAVPAAWLDTGSFQRRQRLDLRALRMVVSLGGPLSAEAAGRIFAWVKPDLCLLARAGDRAWGDPVGPVLARPVPAPSLSSLLRFAG